MRYCVWIILLGVALLGGIAPLQAAERLEPTLSERERIGRESRQALAYLVDYHYSQQALSAINIDSLIRDYISALDYHRMYLTEAEVRAYVARFQPTMVSVYLSRGDIYPALQIYNDLYKIAQKRLSWVQKRLQGNFDFTGRERYAPDRAKAQWPADSKEADTLWNQRLTYELLAEVLNGATLDQAKEKLQKRYERSRRALDEFDIRDLQTTYLTSIGQMYDPHSIYFSNDDLDDFSISMSNTLVGIGALLKDEDGYCVVQELIPGGPAETSGLLHAGDKIVEVAQANGVAVEVIDMKISKVVKMIRGEPGSSVTLTIIPAGTSDISARKKITLERREVRLTASLASAQVIEVPSVDSRQTIAIGVVELPSFYGSSQANSSTTTEDIRELIEKLQGMGIQGLVLDLRRNGGGLLTEAINTVGLFVPRAPVVGVKDSTGRIRTDYTSPTEVVYKGPLVVLTSRQSASASEIVAGALQALDRAIIVGDKSTHGKGTVQSIFEVDRGILAQFLKKTPAGAMKVTIQKFYLPSGATTQHKGVPSDIALPAINDYLPIGEADLPNALSWDTIPQVAWMPNNNWSQIATLNPEKREHLVAESKKRQEKLPEFAYLREIVDRLKAKQEEKALWLNYDLRQKEKKLDDAWKISIEQKREELAKDKYASAEVLLDISWQMKAEHQEQLKSTPLPNGQARAGAIYENIYYYEPKGGLEIKEVNAQKVDFAALRAYTSTFAQRLDLSSTQVESLWTAFGQGDERSEFNIQKNFARALGDSVPADKLEELPKRFFELAIEINPEIAQDHPSLDIPLREALRTAVDWSNMIENSQLEAIEIAEEQSIAN